jgi:hypothetical protein
MAEQIASVSGLRWPITKTSLIQVRVHAHDNNFMAQATPTWLNVAGKGSGLKCDWANGCDFEPRIYANLHESKTGDSLQKEKGAASAAKAGAAQASPPDPEPPGPRESGPWPEPPQGSVKRSRILTNQHLRLNSVDRENAGSVSDTVGWSGSMLGAVIVSGGNYIYLGRNCDPTRRTTSAS